MRVALRFAKLCELKMSRQLSGLVHAAVTAAPMRDAYTPHGHYPDHGGRHIYTVENDQAARRRPGEKMASPGHVSLSEGVRGSVHILHRSPMLSHLDRRSARRGGKQHLRRSKRHANSLTQLRGPLTLTPTTKLHDMMHTCLLKDMLKHIQCVGTVQHPVSRGFSRSHTIVMITTCNIAEMCSTSPQRFFLRTVLPVFFFSTTFLRLGSTAVHPTSAA